MIVPDENILEAQRLVLASSRIAARQIGVDFGPKGLKDEEIIVRLRGRKDITFFTRDAGFYSASLRHPAYCLVVLSIAQNEVATFVRRFLKHPDSSTNAARMGKVVRISHSGIAYYNRNSPTEFHGLWMPTTR